MRWKALFAAVLALAFTSVAPAEVKGPPAFKPQAIKEKNLLAGKTTLDRAHGYILSSYPVRFQGTFIRVPDADDWAAYRSDWEKGFAKAEKDYEREMKEWKVYAENAKAQGARAPSKPPRVTRETFSIGSIEARMLVSFGPGNEFLKEKTASIYRDSTIYRYLTVVRPGTYVWYGPFVLVGGGNCYCMGTVKFEVKPGVITDLGDFLLTVARYDGLTMDDNVNRLPGRFSTSPDGVGEIGPDAAHYGIPSSLSALPSTMAEFHAAGKLNNMFSLMISRVRPIPGILGYRRGEVIDLRTGQPIAIQIAPFDPDAETGEDDGD